jgi:ATP-binding protein involved in chromosome partitioning
MSKDKILEILKQIKYPGYSRDIVSFGVIKDVEISDEGVTIMLKLASNDDDIKSRVQKEILEVLKNEGLNDVRFALEQTTQASGTGTIGSSQKLANIKHTIAVASGKGGVGKSTVAANLAAALSKEGFKVGLLDLDVFGPSLPITMGISEVPKILEGNRLLPLKKYGIELMSLGFILGNDSPVIWRGAMVSKMVSQFIYDVAWGPLDYLIMDLPPGTGDVQLTLTQQLELSGAVIVTTPQDLALIDVQRGANMFSKVNTPILGIIENMSYHLCTECGHKSEIFSRGGGEKESIRLEIPLFGRVPLNEKVMESAEKGEPIVLSFPDSVEAKVFVEIAKSIVSAVENK